MTSGSDQGEETELYLDADTQQISLSSKPIREDTEDRDDRKRIRTRSGDVSVGGGDTVGSFIGRVQGVIKNGSLLAPSHGLLTRIQRFTIGTVSTK